MQQILQNVNLSLLEARNRPVKANPWHCFVALCAIWHGRMMITWHVAHTCPARHSQNWAPVRVQEVLACPSNHKEMMEQFGKNPQWFSRSQPKKIVFTIRGWRTTPCLCAAELEIGRYLTAVQWMQVALKYQILPIPRLKIDGLEEPFRWGSQRKKDSQRFGLWSPLWFRAPCLHPMAETAVNKKKLTGLWMWNSRNYRFLWQ